MKTIFAQSSPYGKSGIAVYRLSGSACLDVAKMLTRSDFFKPRHAHYATIYDPESGAIIDQGIVIFFQGPKSFTGDDM